MNKRSKILVSLSVAICLFSINTLADDFMITFGDGKPGPGPDPRAKAISWEDMKDRCAHPEQFDVQRPPQNIRIQCFESRFTWMISESVEVSMPSSRRIMSGVLADKFFVSGEQKEIQILSKPGPCHRFKKVEEIISMERPVSCSEVLGIKGGLGDFCAYLVDVTKGANPKLVEIKDTGEVMDTCGNLVATGGGGHKPDPKDPK